MSGNASAIGCNRDYRSSAMPRDGSNIYHRPPGTDGVPNYTVESARYNAFTADIEQDANLPRPVVAGGTGSTNAAGAMTNLGGELSAQLIGNYNSDPIQAGSFYSAAGATGAATVNAFTGICYAAVISGSVTTDLFIEARDQVTGNLWVRQKKANVWQPWAQAAGVTTGATPPLSVAPNTLWWDPTRGKLFIYYQDVDSAQWVEAVAVPNNNPNTFVLIAGGTMTGLLVLSADPAAPLGAATKQYADAAGTTGAAAARAVVGNCRLVKSGANLVLLPFNGNKLTINGVNCTVPDAGVTLAPTGLTVSSLYFIYAVATAGVVTSLEATLTSTPHVTSTTAGNKGVEIKSGDDTRSLVGLVRVIVGPAFQDTAIQRFVRSWFNRGTLAMQGAADTVSSIPGTTFAETVTSRIEAVTFAGEAFNGSAFGTATNATAGATVAIQFFADGAVVGNVAPEANLPGASYRCALCCPYAAMMTEGYHYYSYAARCQSGGAFSATYGMTTIGTITQGP